MLRVRLYLAGLLLAVLSVGSFGHAQDEWSRRGRKYKAPPPTSRIEVVVTKHATGKPIANAAVIFRATRNGKDDGNLEIKTDPDGKASLDVITTGSTVLVQVIADGYATYAKEYQVDEKSREIHVAMLRPREQLSAYEDNSGKASTRQPGVQEPEQQQAPPPAAEPTLTPRDGVTNGAGKGGSGTQTSKPAQGSGAGQNSGGKQAPSAAPQGATTPQNAPPQSAPPQNAPQP